MVAPETKPGKEFKELKEIPEAVLFPETTKEKQDRLEKNYGRLTGWVEKIKNSLIKEKPSVKGVPGFEAEEEEIELTEKDIEILETGIVRERAKFLEKVSEALGTNVGGWYEDRETGERHYAKFYENPDQARVEYIANKIYEKLGIPAVESELIKIEGKLAIANREVEGAKLAPKADLRKSKDVRDGFIADTYLANWDVVGLTFDNVMKGTDGRYSRIDNGGSLFFRAQGGAKEYGAESIPELINMTNIEYPSGQVFSTLSEFEKKEQAKKLVETLDDDFLETTVKRSGLPEKEARDLLQSLKGRKEYLRKRFVESNPALIMKELVEYPTARIKKEGALPQVEIKADREIVEHQQIDFVRQRDKILAYFKIRDQFLPKMMEEIHKVQIRRLYKTSSSKDFKFENPQNKRISFPDVAGYRINLREGVNIQFVYDGARSLVGQVAVEIDNKLSDQAEKIMAEVGEWFGRVGIEDLWSKPSAESEEKYIENRYLWHHKEKEMPESARERQSLEEVFPGYTTVVEKDKHKEYEEKYGVKGLIMKISDWNAAAILKSAGLMSSRERYKRGKLITGASTETDFESGGADFVFCRAINQDALDRGKALDDFFPLFDSATFIIDPSQLDRTDWFAYRDDLYGSTRPEAFDQRPDPDKFFSDLQKHFSDGNEIMFQRGIPAEALKSLVVESEDTKREIIIQLRNHGIEDVRGVPLEEYVKVGFKFDKIFK